MFIYSFVSLNTSNYVEYPGFVSEILFNSWWNDKFDRPVLMKEVTDNNLNTTLKTEVNL